VKSRLGIQDLLEVRQLEGAILDLDLDRGFLSHFAHHLARRRAGAQPLERGRSKLSGAGPFHELELCHEPRGFM